RGSVKNVNAYNGNLVFKEDGVVISNQKLAVLNIEPGKDSIISIASWLPKMKEGSEYHAELHFSLAANEPWAPQGSEIASSQFQIKQAVIMPLAKKSPSKLTVAGSSDSVEVKGKDFTIRINNNNGGGLASYVYKGVEQIK